MGLYVSILLLVFYSIFTAAAYISLGSSMQDKDFDIFPNKRPLPSDKKDIYMKVLKAIFILCLLSVYVLMAIQLKVQIIIESKL